MFNPIIHWHLNWTKNQEIFNSYEQQMENLKNRVNEDIIRNQFRKRTQEIYGDKAGNAVLKLADLFNSNNGNNLYQQKIAQMFNELSAMKPFGAMGLKSTDFYKYGQNEYAEITKKIDDYFMGLSKGMDQIASFFGSGMETGAFFKLCASATDTSHLESLIGNSNQIDSISKSRFQKLSSQAKGVLRSFSQHCDINQNDLLTGNKEKIVQNLINYVNGPCRRLIGYAWEGSLANLDSVITEALGGHGARAFASGTQQGHGDLQYSTATTDVKISGGQGRIKFNVPIGISVKVASKSPTHAVNFTVKHGTSLGKMLDILQANLGLMNEQDYEAYANLTTNFNRPKTYEAKPRLTKKTGRQRKRTTKHNYNYPDMPSLNLAINKMLLITGMAGSMDSDDFSTLLIVNDKVMNVYDVLMAAISKNSKQTDTFIHGGVTDEKIRKVSKQHHFYTKDSGDTVLSEDQQAERSRDINLILRNMPITLKLGLSDAMIRKILSTSTKRKV